MAKVTAPFEIEGTIDDLNFFQVIRAKFSKTKGKFWNF